MTSNMVWDAAFWATLFVGSLVFTMALVVLFSGITELWKEDEKDEEKGDWDAR